MCTTFIRRHIARLPRGQMLTTRECLPFGTRAAVDQALSRLVRSGFIRRLARGVFVRSDARASTPSALEIARVKARAFGREIASHGAELAARLGLAPISQSDPTFAVTGHTSSFQAGDVTINLKGTCMRKALSGETLAAHIVRSLWHLGLDKCSPQLIQTAILRCGRTDREELRSAARWMPSWLERQLVAH